MATRNYGNSKRRKEARRDYAILRARVVFARTVAVAIGGELQGGTGADIAPGSDHPECGLIDTWKRINATYDFLVKIENLLACLPVKYGGNVDGEDMARVHTSARPLQREERSDNHTRAGQQHERCADLRYNEHTLTAFAAGRPDAGA